MTPASRRLTCATAEDTLNLGAALGRSAGPGTVIALTGDLGAGKTVFVQGLAKGLEVPPSFYVTSPTYTLINEYPGRLTLFHIDLYRLAGGEDLDELGLEEILHGDGVVAIEWPDRLAPGELPADHLAVRIEIPDPEQEDDGDGPRRIEIRSEGEMSLEEFEDGLKGDGLP